MVGYVSGKDDVLHESQHCFVVDRTEVLKHIAAFGVEDTQRLSEMVPLKGGGRRERERERERERRNKERVGGDTMGTCLNINYIMLSSHSPP